MSRRRRMSEADGRLADVLEGHCSLWSLCHHCSSRRVKVILLINKQGILITDDDDDRRQSDLLASSSSSSSSVAALSLSVSELNSFHLSG